MMDNEEIAVGHNFDFTVKVEGLDFDEKMALCNAFDSYEIDRDVGELLIVDIISFDMAEIVMRITLKKQLTYAEIDMYLKDIVNFAKEKMEHPIKMEPISVKWNVGLFGVPSTRVDIKAMTDRISRMESMKMLRVDVVKEEKRGTEQQFDIKGGMGYLLKGKKAERAFHIFHDLVTHDVPGLCISRTHPEEIKELYGLKNTPLVWLSRKSENTQNVLQPTQLPQISLLVQRFLADAKDSAILLEGIEYLIIHNNFNIILKLLQSLNDDVMGSGSRLLLPLDPDALEAKQLALLERDFKVLE